MINRASAVDARNIRTGKDGILFDGDGTMLATIDTFQAQANITNAKHQFLGDTVEMEVFTGSSTTLTFTETVISDEKFIRELLNGMESGEMPEWNFQGYIKGRNGNSERIIYRNCVPSGSIDLQNVTVGDIIKRAWSCHVNSVPDMQEGL